MPDLSDLTTPGMKEMVSLYREQDTYDPWGAAMETFFAVAHILWHDTAEDIPSAWGYRHAPGCDGVNGEDEWLAYEISVMLADGQITGDDLITFGWVLDKYTNALRAAGRDY